MTKNAKLAVPKGKSVKKPYREPDMVSSRGVPYWFGPEWVRMTTSVGRIIPLKIGGEVSLYMLSKDGNVSYIQGSIQEEFVKWHEDRMLDCILLGFDEDEIIATQWEYI